MKLQANCILQIVIEQQQFSGTVNKQWREVRQPRSPAAAAAMPGPAADVGITPTPYILLFHFLPHIRKTNIGGPHLFPLIVLLMKVPFKSLQN